MIFRLTQKLGAKLNLGALATLPLEENLFADWSAGPFTAGRSPYLLLSNTKSLYSMVLPGKGIITGTSFVKHALRSIRDLLESQGQQAIYERFIEPTSGVIQFAKALNRSVTGSMNDMIYHATYYLADETRSPGEVGPLLNGTPMSALKQGTSTHGFPDKVFADLVSKARA